MEISIVNIKDFSKKEETIIIRNDRISLIDGNSCFEKVLSKDISFINEVGKEISRLVFGWKEEYIGCRSVNGEMYRIVVEINHKKRKYKIQNKFPDNWEEFLLLKEQILGGNYD